MTKGKKKFTTHLTTWIKAVTAFLLGPKVYFVEVNLKDDRIKILTKDLTDLVPNCAEIIVLPSVRDDMRITSKRFR